jgi:Clostripain family
VVWNHGAGFRTARRDIAYDDYGSSLDMTELQRALRRAGLGSRNKLAILGFDACLMSMLEIVYQLRNETHFIVGSQQTEPGDGWPYDQVLGARNGAPTPERMAREIVRVYMKECRKVGDSNVTQSAVRTDRAEAAVRAWSQLGEALAAALPGEGTSSATSTRAGDAGQAR